MTNFLMTNEGAIYPGERKGVSEVSASGLRLAARCGILTKTFLTNTDGVLS